ncbi:MAG: SH3 domain-containing protein [Caldilineaceae bacterium]|nr:SH3 domain-containing protein [Caldilineaceae bacterium]
MINPTMPLAPLCNTARLERGRILSRRLLAMLFVTLVFTAVRPIFDQRDPPPAASGKGPMGGFLFQSFLPEPAKPDTWIYSGEGGVRKRSVITINLPPGFTNQGGANVFADIMSNTGDVAPLPGGVPGAYFAVGIWPANDQTRFQRPIEIRIVLNAAQFTREQATALALYMFHPEQMTWAQLPTEFAASSFELMTRTQEFIPVAKDFPTWGGRTIFAVAPATTAAAKTIVTTNANLRAGPGIGFPIVGFLYAGAEVHVVATNTAGDWSQLSGGQWVWSRLIDSPALAETLPMTTTRSAVTSP